MMNPFSEEMKSAIQRFKYSKWAAGLDETTLFVLISNIGEFGYRSRKEGYINPHKYNSQIASTRRDIGMETILRIFRGERFTGDDPIEVTRKVHWEAFDRRCKLDGPRIVETRNEPIFLIFLDFDGVLHPLHASEHEMFRPEAISSVNRIVDELGANIVLSTSWRMDYGADKFNTWFKQQIIGTTPIHELDLQKENPRFHEIMSYLEDRGWLHIPWVAIDDKRSHFPDDTPAYITDSKVGITEKDADNIILIGKSMKFAQQSPP